MGWNDELTQSASNRAISQDTGSIDYAKLNAQAVERKDAQRLQNFEQNKELQGTYGQRAQDLWGIEGMKEAGANARADMQAQSQKELQGTYGQRAQDLWGMKGMEEAGVNARADMQAQSQRDIHGADIAAANWRWTNPQEAYRDVPTKRDPYTGEITSKVMLGSREVDADPAATEARRAMDKYAYMSKFDPKDKDQMSYLAQDYSKHDTPEQQAVFRQAMAFQNPKLIGAFNAHLTNQAQAQATQAQAQQNAGKPKRPSYPVRLDPRSAEGGIAVLGSIQPRQTYNIGAHLDSRMERDMNRSPSPATPLPPVTPIVSQNPPTFYGTGATEPALEGTAKNVTRINLRNRFGGEEQNPNITYNYNVESSVAKKPVGEPVLRMNNPSSGFTQDKDGMIRNF